MDNLADFFITSAVEVIVGDAPEGAYKIDDIENIAVMPHDAIEHKCPRCWKHIEPARDAEHTELCPRCVEAVKEL